FLRCSTAIRDHSYRFRSCAHVSFRYTAVWACPFHTKKIDAHLGCDSSRDRRGFHARLFAFFDLRRSLLNFSWRLLFRLFLFLRLSFLPLCFFFPFLRLLFL